MLRETVRCGICGQPMFAHAGNGTCPPCGVVAVIDADTLDRVNRTGHPRTLRLLLNADPDRQIFRDVAITSLRASEVR